MTMSHAIYRVESSRIVGPYTLRVKFDDETEQTIDFRPVLEGDLYGPLRDRELFDQARIDEEVHTLAWPNGADFDPATLHDWPDQLPAMKASVRQWKTVWTDGSLASMKRCIYANGAVRTRGFVAVNATNSSGHTRKARRDRRRTSSIGRVAPWELSSVSHAGLA
jgi:hypothetical protein